MKKLQFTKEEIMNYLLIALGSLIYALGQLYFILAHFREINEALTAVGGDPLQDLWYWSSTQYSAAGAWTLNLNHGHAGNTTKATNQGRVRPVSAFLPLTVNL